MDQLFDVVGLSPPSNANAVYVSQIETAINELLRPINKTFSDFGPNEQAKLSFLLLRGYFQLSISVALAVMMQFSSLK
jgi:hypothetical protein